MGESKQSNTDIVWNGCSNTNIRDYIWIGHLGQGNWLFADGHVKSMKPSQTNFPFNMWGGIGGSGGCTSGDINCDTPDGTITSGMAMLETLYP